MHLSKFIKFRGFFDCTYLDNSILMETGHHKISTVAEFVNSHDIKRLFFIHHGREILGGGEEAKEKIKAVNLPAYLTNDADIFEF